MTYPMIGNYGVNSEDVESDRIHVAGFVVKEYSKTYSNYRATGSLGDYLKDGRVAAIEGIDTRKLTRHIRDRGAIKAGIFHHRKNAMDKLKAHPDMKGLTSPLKLRAGRNTGSGPGLPAAPKSRYLTSASSSIYSGSWTPPVSILRSIRAARPSGK
jgi:hypothetical protein